MYNPTDEIAAVRDAIQRGYGDASQTVLDHQVSAGVVKTLRERGWYSPEDVAMLVLAAGGSIEVTDRERMAAFRGDVEVQRLYLPDTMTDVIRARLV